MLAFRQVSHNTKVILSKTKKARGFQRQNIYVVPVLLSSSAGTKHLAGTNPQAGNSVSILPGDAELHSKGVSQASGLKLTHGAAKCFGLSWGSNRILFSTCLKQAIWQQGAESGSEIGVKSQQVPVNVSRTQAKGAVSQGRMANTWWLHQEYSFLALLYPSCWRKQVDQARKIVK